VSKREGGEVGRGEEESERETERSRGPRNVFWIFSGFAERHRDLWPLTKFFPRYFYKSEIFVNL